MSPNAPVGALDHSRGDVQSLTGLPINCRFQEMGGGFQPDHDLVLPAGCASKQRY